MTKSSSQPYLLRPYGQKWPLLQPTVSDVDFREIGLILARMPWLHCSTPKTYSVAQHLLVLSEFAQAPLKLDALLCLAHKAYINDLRAPVFQDGKRMTTLARIESGVGYAAERVIYQAAGRTPLATRRDDYQAIAQLEQHVMAAEILDLTTMTPPAGLPMPVKRHGTIVPLTESDAAMQWSDTVELLAESHPVRASA